MHFGGNCDPDWHSAPSLSHIFCSISAVNTGHSCATLHSSQQVAQEEYGWQEKLFPPKQRGDAYSQIQTCFPLSAIKIWKAAKGDLRSPLEAWCHSSLRTVTQPGQRCHFPKSYPGWEAQSTQVFHVFLRTWVVILSLLCCFSILECISSLLRWPKTSKRSNAILSYLAIVIWLGIPSWVWGRAYCLPCHSLTAFPVLSLDFCTVTVVSMTTFPTSLFLTDLFPMSHYLPAFSVY